MPKWRSTSSRRQKPTRMPYSCHAQFGRSGNSGWPIGGGSTVRGIGRPMSHSSTLTAFLRAWAKGAEAAKIDRDAVAAMARHNVPEEWEAEAGGQGPPHASMKKKLPPTPGD